MVILGIETSCDETACSILQKDNNRITILSKVLASSSELQAKYGGVIPDQSAREQLRSILPVIEETLNSALITPNSIDAIAVTQGPGLIGSLLVGVETAKTLSLVWDKPLIPINHLIAHFYANWVEVEPPTFPAIGLLVSGGHTDLILMKDHGDYEYLGGTRDDAAGECFDKCARLLNLPYPGGPNLSKLAEGGDSNRHSLPKPMWDSGDFDFSFSGLKTAFSLLVSKELNLEKGHFDKQNLSWVQKSLEQQLDPEDLKKAQDLSASLEKMIIETLIKKTLLAIQRYKVEQLIISGGVAANSNLQKAFKKMDVKNVSVPNPNLCTDNAVMVTAAAFYTPPIKNPLDLQADPSLSLRR